MGLTEDERKLVEKYKKVIMGLTPDQQQEVMRGLGASIEKDEREEAIEVKRLRNILKKFGVREKLRGIKEKIWKEGLVSALGKTAYEKWTKGNVVELELKTDYPDLKSEFREGEVIKDYFYPQGRTTMSKFYVPTESIAILTVGAASVNSIEAVRKGNPVDGISETGDYIYVGFRRVDIVRWAEKEVLGFSSFSGDNRKLRISSATDLEVSQFIDEQLVELTSNRFLPSALRARAQEERAKWRIK